MSGDKGRRDGQYHAEKGSKIPGIKFKNSLQERKSQNGLLTR